VSKQVRFGDLSYLSKYDVVKINRADFWGVHLAKNRKYSDGVFARLNAYQGFPVLFKSLFAIKRRSLMKQRNCSWFFQFRTMWAPPYSAGPFDNHIKCAAQFGLAEKDYATSWVISDNPAAIMATSSEPVRKILTQMNLPKHKITCRGKCGDEQAMQTVYSLSGCRHAVVSLGSSFGSCIAGLAHVDAWIRVGHDGYCKLARHGVVDANCLGKQGCRNTYMLDAQNPQ